MKKRREVSQLTEKKAKKQHNRHLYLSGGVQYPPFPFFLYLFLTVSVNGGADALSNSWFFLRWPCVEDSKDTVDKESSQLLGFCQCSVLLFAFIFKSHTKKVVMTFAVKQNKIK